VGARHISLALLPTKIPAFRKEGLKLNPAYRDLVPALRQELGIDLQLNQFGTYLDDIYAHPSRYGIVDTQSRCAPSPLLGENVTPCRSPDAHFYYFDDHPSAAVNRIAGDKLFAEITADPRRSSVMSEPPAGR
jgi:phospholipase/lecithinase/hemolysin